MDNKCDAVVAALKGVYDHLDQLVEVLPGMPKNEAEELYVVAAVKIKRMYRQFTVCGRDKVEEEEVEVEPVQPVAYVPIINPVTTH